ncbi:MAG: hypothetical protein ACP5PT_07990 [Brevinematia bacterium]
MNKRRVFVFLIFFILLFSSYSYAQDFSKVLIGFSCSYFNYNPLENSSGLSLSSNKILVGFNVGFASRGLIFDFSYLHKLYPNEIYNFSGYSVNEQFDSYLFSLAYVFTISDNYFYLGPSLFFSIDSSQLKFYNQFNFSSFLNSAIVKDIDSKVVSLGAGISIVVFRNLLVKISYFYSFTGTYSYQGVNMPDSFIFQPSGLRVILNINV